MKDNSAPVITAGNLPDLLKKHEAGIDVEGKKFLFSILSNQYSNKEKAVLREYTTNAWDSHVVAGNSAPIEVTLPTDLQPTLLIRDYGTGLTQDEVLTLLGDYGASTKRGDNDTVGKMGIGSKSAITLVSQYVVTAVKDGVKNVVVFGLNENGILEGKVVPTCDNQPTSEPNGVLISLAVDDVDAMRREADLYFSKWWPGHVLVDGTEPVCVWDAEDTVRLNDHAFAIPDHDGGVFAVMGQVSYDVSRDLLRKVRTKFEDESTGAVVVDQLLTGYDESAIFLHVEIGAVDIAPSRESLMDSFLTIKSLTEAIQHIADSLSTKVQTAVDAEPNAFAGIIKFEELRASLKPLKVGRKSITYKGLRLREVQKIEMPALFISRHWSGNKYVEGVVLGKDYELESKRAGSVLVVRIKAGEEGSVKRYAKRFLEAHEEYKAILLAVDIDGASYGWFTFGGDTGGATVWTLDEYRAHIKSLRENDPRNRTEVKYSTGWGHHYHDDYSRDLLSDIISWGKDIVVYQGSHASGDENTQAALEDYTILCLSKQQSVEALRKRVEKDGSVRVLTTQERNRIVADYVSSKFAVSDVEKEAVGAHGWLTKHLSYITSKTQAEAIADALGEDTITSRTFLDVLDTIRLARMTYEAVSRERIQEIHVMASQVGAKEDTYSTPFEADYVDISDVYPLLRRVQSYDLRDDVRHDGPLRDEVRDYINGR